jgi:hypothetical protein
MARRKAPRIPDAILDQALAGADPKSAFEADGLLDELKKALAERALNAEMGHHPAGEDAGNTRNGYGRKIVTTETGRIELAIPRDRQATTSAAAFAGPTSSGWMSKWIRSRVPVRAVVHELRPGAAPGRRRGAQRVEVHRGEAAAAPCPGEVNPAAYRRIVLPVIRGARVEADEADVAAHARPGAGEREAVGATAGQVGRAGDRVGERHAA